MLWTRSHVAEHLFALLGVKHLHSHKEGVQVASPACKHVPRPEGQSSDIRSSTDPIVSPHLIPGVAVQPLLEALLVQRMANEANGARQHKEAIQVADLDDVLDLSLSKHSI